MEKLNVVSGVTCNKNEVKFSLLGVPDKPGIASMIFSRLADVGINVDMIIQNIHYDDVNDITFTIDHEDFEQAHSILEKLKDELSYRELISDVNVAKVSIVGAGMSTNPGVAARMFEALGRDNINIEMISTSEIKVSCLIEEDEADQAVAAIHNEFELDEE